MVIYKEVLADHRRVAIERDTMRWEAPHEMEAVDDDVKERVVANMRRALASRGYDLVLLDDSPP